MIAILAAYAAVVHDDLDTAVCHVNLWVLWGYTGNPQMRGTTGWEFLSFHSYSCQRSIW